MNIVLIGDGRWNHATNWANLLSEKGHKVWFISLHDLSNPVHKNVQYIKIGSEKKINYILCAYKLRKKIRDINPDIVNVHYLSGYGTLVTLSGVVSLYPVAGSVWGSDVYDFPRVSLFHKLLVKFNLYRCTGVCSTSGVMASWCRNYLNYKSEIIITPFGINMDTFRQKTRLKTKKSKDIHLGTVKKLEQKYGIDHLIRLFSCLVTDMPDYNFSLTIVGDGSQRSTLEELALNLGISSSVKFVGQVEHSEVKNYLNSFDIYFALSTLDSESFGVAILEASSTGLPVVVSNKGGLPEVVKNGETGLIVDLPISSENYNNIKRLVSNPELQSDMGKKGILNVFENFSNEICVGKMEDALKLIFKKGKGE